MSLTVLVPGPLSTVQDAGRTGYQAFGFSPSGAADLDALRWGNLLLGNDRDEAGIEMTISGMTVRFDSDCTFVLTGADDSPRLNDSGIEMNRVYAAKAGDVLTCAAAKNGVRTYLGIAGGLDLPLVMGSRSTGMKFKVGGYSGRRLMKGDVLWFRNPGKICERFEKRHMYFPDYPTQAALRVIPGPQDSLFAPETMKRFFQEEYTVSGDSDRMGIRLEGWPVEAMEKCDIISDATVTGAIQISNGGKPILLLQDRQTTGGYAKIACVISADLPLAGQLSPGSKVRFVPVPVKEARKALLSSRRSYFWKYLKLNHHLPDKK